VFAPAGSAGRGCVPDLLGLSGRGAGRGGNARGGAGPASRPSAGALDDQLADELGPARRRRGKTSRPPGVVVSQRLVQALEPDPVPAQACRRCPIRSPGTGTAGPGPGNDLGCRRAAGSPGRRPARAGWRSCRTACRRRRGRQPASARGVLLPVQQAGAVAPGTVEERAPAGLIDTPGFATRFFKRPAGP